MNQETRQGNRGQAEKADALPDLRPDLERALARAFNDRDQRAALRRLDRNLSFEMREPLEKRLLRLGDVEDLYRRSGAL